MFCTKCGNQIAEGEKFCTSCGNTIGSNILSRETADGLQTTDAPHKLEEKAFFDIPDEGQPENKKSRTPLIIAVATVCMLIIIGIILIAGYDLVKTKEFKEKITAFEEVRTEVDGLGKYDGEYDEMLDSADSAASHFAFWKYEDIAEQMSSLANEIVSMNEAVAEYREQYEAIVNEIETDGHYVMDDYLEEYQDIKADLEEALSDFDEKEAKKKADDFADIRDDIIEENEAMASSYMDDADNIQASFDGYNAHPFELYMIGDFVSRLEADRDEQDFIKLSDDYEQLKEWSDKFYLSTQSYEQIAGFIQADVSEDDEVKLYLNSYNYDEYNFKLEEFMIYEENGGDWSECEAVDISQIRGALTMDLVVDVSSSMRNDFYTMQCAVEGFVNSTYSDTELGLSTIGSIYERYQEFTSNKDSIINSAWSLECNGLTSLYQSLYSSVIYTASAEGARCVVAFTDGNNVPYGAGYDYDAQDVIDVSNLYQVPVYIIGIGSNVYSSDLRYIAEATGGEYYDRVSIYDLQGIYESIYETQGKLYQLSYKTAVANNVNRDIYVLYADSTNSLSVRLESELNAEVLQEAYETSSFTADDLSSFYTDGKYLSSDDLSKLGEDLDAVQTIINIYYAKNGYQFGDTENGQKQLAKMVSMGVISENGTLGGDEVSAIIMQNPVLYQNFSALYNYRYELIYTAAYNIYMSEPSISYEDLRSQVHAYYGEENEKRYDPVTQTAWKAINSI